MCDPVEELGNAVGAVVDAVGDVFDAVGDAVSWVVDEVIDPVMTTVGQVIESALDNPVKTLAQIAAITTPGMQWALPLIEGADVAIKGGDLGDVLEATAKAYVVQEVGSYVGKAAGAYAGEAAAGVEYGTSGSQAAMLAAQEAGMATSSALAAELAGAAAGSAAVAVVTGQDPLKAALTGGAGAAVPAILGQVSGFRQLPNAAQRIISAAVTTELSGGNVSAGVINAAIAATGLTTDIIKQIDPNGKLSSTQTAILSDILMGTASAALTGGNPTNVVRAAMLKAGSKALGDTVTGAFKDATTATDTAMARYKEKATLLEANENDQKTAAADYNNMASQLNIRLDEQKRLADIAERAIATYNNDKTRANFDAATAAKNAADAYTTSLNKDYADFYRPKLQEYNTALTNLQTKHDEITLGYTKASEEVKTSVDKLTQALDPIYFTSNRAFVEAMNPEFKADEYAKINGLKADQDPYEHFLSVGQFKGLPINNDAAKALANGDASGTAVDKSTGAVAADKVFDGSKYASTIAAQKAAAATGMTYFKAPDGNTYQILSDAESKTKIKNAATFGEAFTMARKTLGSGATFEWTNPDTGKTSSFTTQTKEEAAASANAGSLVKVNDTVTNYVTDKILSNVTDYKNFNPANLTKAEYNQFIGAYLNATDSQRQQMLKGADQMTFGVIANVLKEAPEAIKTKSMAFSVVPTGEIKASDYTNIFGTIKTGMNMAAADLAGVGVRAAQWVGDALGADTSTLTKMQDILAKGKDTDMSKLVGMERPVAAGIASLVESFGSFYVGGPVTSLLTNGAIAANNAWVEGGSAVISTSRFSEGNSYSSAEEAEKNGVFAYRKLTTQENALRTAAMASMEVAFEKLGIPGMNKIMQGVPLTGGTDAFVEGIRRNAAGMLTEQSTEIATTVAQLTFDKVSSFGLAQNATFADYARAVGDTIVSVAVTVGGSTSAATLLNNVRNASMVLRDESSIGVTPLTYNSVVAKDATGQNVTLAELLTANSIANFADPNANADLAKLTPVADLRSVVNLGDMNVKLGDLLNGTQTVSRTTDVLTESAVAEIFRASNFVPNDNTVKGFVGQPASTATFTNINKFVDQNKLDAKEVIEVAKKEGVTLTEAQAQQYVQQGDEAALSAKLASQLDPTATTFEEAKSFFAQRGYVPTDAEINQFVGARAEAAQATAIGEYVNPRQVTEAEARKYLTDLGYKSTDAEVKQFVGQVNESEQAKAIREYVDPRMVDEGEAKAAYDALGLKRPTQADVQKLLGQYSESELAGKAKANLDPARYNSIMEQLDTLAKQSGVDPAVLETIKKDLNSQITALGGDVSKLSGQVGTLQTDLAQTEKDILAEVAKNEQSGMTRDAALQKAIETVAASQKTDTATLTSKIAGVQTALGTEIKTLQSSLDKTKTDILTQVAQNEQAGMTRDAALQKAISDVAATQKTDTASLLTRLGTTEANLKAQFATQISGLDTKLTAAIADAKASGLAGDAALKAAIDKVAADQGTTAANLLAKIGTTEAALKSQFATQIAGVQTQISNVQASLTKAIADAQAAGLQGDAALQAAIDKVAGNLGTTKADLLAQMGTTEANLKAQFATQIGAVQQQVTDVQKAIADQMAAYEKAGLARDDALSLAVTTVANNLGTTKTDLLTKIGTTEANLKAQITGISADVQAKYDALTAEQKALAAQLQQQGVDLNTAIQQAQQQTQTQISGLTQDVQTKYDTLTQGQKDLATQLQQQGFDLNTAIQLARSESAAGFKDVFGQMATNQAATQKAIADAQAAAAADAEKTRQAQAAAALKTQRVGNLNSMMGMLTQAPDVSGQQVTVKAADPTKIGYIYDWNSIFANPSQEKMFASPYGAYAKGGVVGDDILDANEELLKILRG